MFDAMAERQELAERDEATPLIVHPEGGTTNGRALIKFKKGAFAALKSVKPCGIKYWSNLMPIQYLWDNHMKEGEDKVTCYSRVVRNIMAEEFGFTLAEINMEEKFDYRHLIWPNKGGSKSE